MSNFWHWVVVAIVVGSFIGTMWLLFANARGKAGEGDTGHVWDDDLREYNNPLPRWWLNVFVATTVFGALYLTFYPGLGNFAGRLGWTEQKQLHERLDALKAQRDRQLAKFHDRDVASLATDPAARTLGRNVFLNNCAGCHGADAHGALGFPNLSDKDWLYGGTPEAIVASVTHGRNGQMPAFNGAIDAPTFDALVRYVQHWNDPKLDASVREQAQKQFAITCAACHGPDGHGNQVIGAPNLTDTIWLHGGTRERIRETILFGRRSAMPAHEKILSPDEIKLVSAYVYSLSQQPGE
ncbi:cytochrome-c oxidase, cbb3-type subunit III [Solimonas terrae]|uniref:Cbb3-type cytochrome c oxidase subunit n=1 Tax=Solimonas terrae TaxID=1396819 RepID=A0A6M2BLI7_9GAMM|nr:cytochrome-c oxidase, cbb3-type subunit III [Solimonas terrae]NGY03191.1 cytochrome-c oxidase, cbb3-type subunit III [Solimonas terrae]